MRKLVSFIKDFQTKVLQAKVGAFRPTIEMSFHLNVQIFLLLLWSDCWYTVLLLASLRDCSSRLYISIFLGFDFDIDDSWFNEYDKREDMQKSKKIVAYLLYNC